MTLTAPHVSSMNVAEFIALREAQTNPQHPCWLIVFHDGSIMFELMDGLVDWHRRDAPDVRFYLYTHGLENFTSSEGEDAPLFGWDLMDARDYWSEGARGHVD